jgi:hypothetical protein
MNRFRIRYELKAALWFIPLLSLVAFIALAVVTLAIDRAEDYKPIAQSVTGSATSLQQTEHRRRLAALARHAGGSSCSPRRSRSNTKATLSCATAFRTA